MKESPDPHFFETPAAMRAWLEANHLEAKELHVGYHKRHAVGEATPSMALSQRGRTSPDSFSGGRQDSKYVENA
jgi:hypothetical protein